MKNVNERWNYWSREGWITRNSNTGYYEVWEKCADGTHTILMELYDIETARRFVKEGWMVPEKTQC